MMSVITVAISTMVRKAHQITRTISILVDKRLVDLFATCPDGVGVVGVSKIKPKTHFIIVDTTCN